MKLTIRPREQYSSKDTEVQRMRHAILRELQTDVDYLKIDETGRGEVHLHWTAIFSVTRRIRELSEGALDVIF